MVAKRALGRIGDMVGEEVAPAQLQMSSGQNPWAQFRWHHPAGTFDLSSMQCKLGDGVFRRRWLEPVLNGSWEGGGLL